jgi:hypothetical protein
VIAKTKNKIARFSGLFYVRYWQQPFWRSLICKGRKVSKAAKSTFRQMTCRAHAQRVAAQS